MRRNIKFFLILLFCFNFVSLKTGAAISEGDMEKAKEFVTYLKDEGIDAILKKGTSKADKIKKFDEIIIKEIDFEFVSSFVLGAKWRGMSGAQKEKFIDLFKQMNLYSWSAKFDLYSGEKMEVVGANQAKQADQVFVDMKVIPTDVSKEPSVCNLRLKQAANGKFEIVDIIIEGISMALNYRDEFKSIMQKAETEGKDGIEELLNKLDSKVVDLKAKAYASGK